MAPTEGRVARPEQRWGCCCGTPMDSRKGCDTTYSMSKD